MRHEEVLISGSATLGSVAFKEPISRLLEMATLADGSKLRFDKFLTPAGDPYCTVPDAVENMIK